MPNPPSPSEQRLFELVQQALQQPRAARADFLETACADDPRLLRKARLLLPVLHQETTAFQPETSAAPSGRASVPSQIGPYELLEVLGEGGMGTVYLAEQKDPIQRHVAVKVMRKRRPKTGETDTARLRFELERRTLARMNHLNIAQVFEAGDLEDGRPYLVMEHVPGVPIDRYCDENEVDVEARLRLFLQVCAGIHHAHQKGVLHRDIKPLNLLVTEQDEPGGTQRAVVKVLDFGIAKELDTRVDSQLTVGFLVGTPAFASPEMASERDDETAVDIRSDVYSLGVLLFLLLTGEMPHDIRDQTVLDYFRKLTETDPVTPSSRFEQLPEGQQAAIAQLRGISAPRLHRRLQGDLDQILLKALAREREERYDSVAAFAEDVQRFLAFEPVQARPPGKIYLFRKFLRRNRAAVAAATLILLALVGGLVARGIEAQRARLAQAEAQEVTDFLLELFEDARPPGSEAEEVTLRQVLERGTERIETAFADEPTVRARLLTTMGNVYLVLGDYDLARQLLQSVGQVYNENPPEPPMDRAIRLRSLGKAHRFLGQTDTAENLLLGALEAHRELVEPGHQELAFSLYELGHFYNLAKQPESAIPYFEEILDRHGYPTPESSRHIQLEALSGLGSSYILQGELEKGIELLQQCIRAKEAQLGDTHLNLVAHLTELGSAHLQLGNLEEAAVNFERTLRIKEARLTPGHSAFTYAYINLATTYGQMGRIQESETYLLKGLDNARATLGMDHMATGSVLVNLAALAQLDERYEDAIEFGQEGLRVFLLHMPPEQPIIRQLMESLADLNGALGREDQVDYWRGRLARLGEPTSVQDPFGMTVVDGSATAQSQEAESITDDRKDR